MFVRLFLRRTFQKLIRRVQLNRAKLCRSKYIKETLNQSSLAPMKSLKTILFLFFLSVISTNVLAQSTATKKQKEADEKQEKLKKEVKAAQDKAVKRHWKGQDKETRKRMKQTKKKSAKAQKSKKWSAKKRKE